MSDRFKCLKPESDNTFRKNRFQNNRLKEKIRDKFSMAKK